MKVVQYCRGRHYKFCNGQWHQRLSIGKKGIIPKFCPPRPKTELYFQYGGANSIHFEEDTTMQAKSLGRGRGMDGREGVAETFEKFTPLENMERIIPLHMTYPGKYLIFSLQKLVQLQDCQRLTIFLLK